MLLCGSRQNCATRERSLATMPSLADDIVTADDNVAREYMSLLDRLGVEISLSKSLISKSGACEFAKRFRLDRCTVDVSPLSIKRQATVRSPIGWYNYVLTINRPLRLSTLLRIAGLGFKASSRPIGLSKHGKRARRLLIMRFYGILSTTLWLACSLGWCPAPEVIGAVIDRLRQHFVPRDPVEPPLDAFAYQGHRDFLEWSLYQGWMRQHLTYLQWSCSVALPELHPSLTTV